jgi:hypothetical protein
MAMKDTLTARFFPPFMSLLILALLPAAQTYLDLPSVVTGQNRRETRRDGTNLVSTRLVSTGNLRPLLWREPVDLERRNLFYGIGGREGMPHAGARYTFIRHSDSGTQPKIIVKDDRGREWTVKFGREARPETVTTRIVWAVGYHTDQDYFVRQAYIGGKESFDARDVRFELRDDEYKEIGDWSWKENQLAGTREMNGLKVLMALLKNWDLKSKNNKIIQDKRRGQIIYYVSDLGASLGRTGSWFNNIPIFADLPPDKFGGNRGKGHPEAFADEDFIDKVRDGKVVFHFERSRGRSILKDVPVSHARWMGNLLGRLSDTQLTDAFRAGGFTNSEATVYVRTLRARINQLQNLDRFAVVARR